jgi:ABC-type branched-subunit amino acid transport system ATPase component/ABC-type branched-subunit amino acid transport system permease subunit
VGVVLTAATTLLYRLTGFGRATAAVAENQVVAASLTHSPDVIASINWALGSVLAGLAGVLIAPILFLEPTSLVLLVVPALTAALIGQFRSFPITLGMALGLGVASSEIDRYVSQPGWATAAPFLVVVAVLAARGQMLPLRSFVLDRLPAVGSGRIRPGLVLVICVVGAIVTLRVNADWAPFLITTLALAIICLSVVLITGYGGQLSLAQSVLAGVGALAAAKVSSHLPFIGSLAVGAVTAGLAGLLIGIPALRTRGVTLAIATLGLSASLAAVVLENTNYNGGTQGIAVQTPSLFGWDLDPLFDSSHYTFVVFVILVLIAILLTNLRRGVTGRRLLAMRSNERASAALGVPNAQLKLYVFVLSAAIAGVGGVLLAFQQPVVEVSLTDNFSVFAGILIASVTVVGGVGYIGGGIIGSTLIAGGIISQIFSGWSQVNNYLPLIGGISLLLVLIFQPDGIFESNRRALAAGAAAIARRVPLPKLPLPRRDRTAFTVASARSLQPKELVVSNLSVSFGGVHAVQDVTLDVRPGEVHGLIGPNGAGKTTVIDAITGFVRASAGTVRIGTREVDGWAARRRANAGISRSFQSLELFDDLTILENIAVASERPSALRYVLDWFVPGRIHLSSVALEAMRDFGLLETMERKPGEVSFGQRKTVAIARAIAAGPSVLLLDEPAAGLDDHEATELADLIVRIAREWGIGVLLVEHKVDMITSISDRITVLNNGRVLASGVTADVVGNPDVVAAYLGTALPV